MASLFKIFREIVPVVRTEIHNLVAMDQRLPSSCLLTYLTPGEVIAYYSMTVPSETYWITHSPFALDMLFNNNSWL